MAFELDPIFHTETMVKILREQGHSLHAMELAEQILLKDPENESVRKILEELKAESREAFERFRKGGKEGDELSPEVETTQPEGTLNKKVNRLQKILANIQLYRKAHEVEVGG